MIINEEKLHMAKYLCRKPIAEYLVFKKGMSTLSVTKGYYIFAVSDKLHDALKKMPVHLKAYALITSHTLPTISE